jgi:hypothetical protein
VVAGHRQPQRRRPRRACSGTSTGGKAVGWRRQQRLRLRLFEGDDADNLDFSVFGHRR